MDGLLVVLVPVVALLLWGAISPRSQWRTLFAWRYRNPEANEPSDAVYLLTRLGNIAMIGLLVWVAVGMSTGDDDGARPAATTRPPAATATGDSAAELKAAFGVDQATVITPPVVTAAPKSSRPVKIVLYREVDAAGPPAYVAQALAGRTGTWVVLGVRADTPPTGVRFGKVLSGLLAVDVFTGCEAPCPTATVESGANFYLLPVQIDRSLGGRLLVDAYGKPLLSTPK
ncbi:hypothetical protein [Actinoplanes sp. HUAS TT8]|uniref:hypothetical protein n=1 Tax=Actinoplanes sp. HUAS TT8 TaxID=3447453 RepID=UPI003F51D650